jgi:hypothetical protein
MREKEIGATAVESHKSANKKKNKINSNTQK